MSRLKTMDFKKMLGIILIFVVVMFAFMLASSYAWYSFENASTKFDVVTNDEVIDVVYHTGKYINTSNAIPVSSLDVDKYADSSKFSIDVNDRSLVNGVVVSVDLVNVTIDKELINDSFKYELLLDDTLVSEGNFSGFSGDMLEVSNYVVLNSLSDNDFELRLYILDDGSDQSSMMNKTFKGTISINVVSRLKVDVKKLGADIVIRDITIDGKSSDYVPVKGYYDMVSSCDKGSVLEWEPLSKTVSFVKGNKSGDVCSLSFTTSKSPVYPLLADMKVGSYVSYAGTGGAVGEDYVRCKSGGSSSSSGNGETESSNACSGANAREDLEKSDYTFGYCSSSKSKFTTTGFRIAYIDSSNGGSKAVLVSAGSPECVTRSSSLNNEDFIKKANSRSLKYCNSKFVDGDCSCVDKDNDGLCDSESLDAWSINDNDFYLMTKAISGSGKRLSEFSSSLGDVSSSFSSLYCNGVYSYRECGYNNDLIDNGGYYWFASGNGDVSNTGIMWNANYRGVLVSDEEKALGLRPVIRLSASVYVTGGKGTMDDPYTIGN